MFASRVQFVGQDVCGRQRGVTAEVHFDGRCEPPQRPRTTYGEEESRFGNAEFEGNLLEAFIREGAFQQDHDGGITTLIVTDERVDPPHAVAKGNVDVFHT
jgi:hypothetical protein